MEITRTRHARLPAFAGAALAVGLADFATKSVITSWLTWGETRWLIDGVIGLELTENRGIAFGLGDGTSFTLALVAVGFVLLALVVFRTDLATGLAGAIALGAAAGGAISNLIDRFADGAVTDFFVFGPWPRFNVADAALTLGLLTLVIMEFRADLGRRA
ncbi:MAG TPA: signal peptidase II [Thermomicrobiales bacterium]|nr:signal peptidase II [Thermomicrobiales bacterium]